MALEILSTKLHTPAPPASLVPRIHLTSRLEAGTHAKLILVSAPAGFGKTTLLAEWVEASRDHRQVSWLHLEEADNDVVRFLTYVISALQIHQQDLGEAALSGLGLLPPPPLETALTSLVNDIASLQRDTLLILDDYHVIEDPAIHAAVGFLIEHLPSCVCLAIATRADPPLPIHQWRARGDVAEFRMKDLRLNRDETRAFLTTFLKAEVSEDDLAALDRRVEGWVAGLQLIALSLQGREDIPEFIASFTGSHRFVMDFLTEEIYQRQPPDLQEFLLKTSVLERLCGPLCDAVLGRDAIQPERIEREPHSQEVLESLERANLFLVPLDDVRKWYRYHHLFANVLRQQLRRTWPEAIPGLRRRASAWCAANGQIDEAVNHAVAGDDLEAAVLLLELHSQELLHRGDIRTLQGWLDKLPEATVLGRPWLSIFSGWIRLLSGRSAGIERFLRAAEERQFEVKNSDELRGHVAAIRAYASMWSADPEHTMRLAQQALDMLPSDEISVRSVATFVLGGARYIRGELQQARETMIEASRLGTLGGNFHVAVPAMSAVGDILLGMRNLAEAEKTFRRALSLGTGRSGKPLPIAAGIYSGLARLHIARGDLAQARKDAMTGLELGIQWANIDSQIHSLLGLGQVEHLEGHPDQARSALERAKHLAATHDLTPGTDQQIVAFEALIHGQPRQASTASGRHEPLTERELEVLRLMAEGRSNAEIAGTLIVALGTVKAHTSSIYRKLDARGRAQAVIRARELRLI